MAITKKTGWSYKVCTQDGTNNYDQLSLWTDCKDVETRCIADNESATAYTPLSSIDLEDELRYVEGVLPAGQTTITLPNGTYSQYITANGMLDIYVDTAHAKVCPKTVQQTNGQVVLTFPAQSSNMTVRVRCWK